MHPLIRVVRILAAAGSMPQYWKAFTHGSDFELTADPKNASSGPPRHTSRRTTIIWASRLPGLRPRSVRGGAASICTCSIPAHTKSSTSSPIRILPPRPPSCGTGMLPKRSSAPTSSTSRVTRSFRCRRRASGWIWTSIATIRGPGGDGVELRIHGEGPHRRRRRSGTARCGFRGERSILVRRRRAGNCASACSAFGPGEKKAFYAWRPPIGKSFHVPQAFGTLRLRDAKRPRFDPRVPHVINSFPPMDRRLFMQFAAAAPLLGSPAGDPVYRVVTSYKPAAETGYAGTLSGPGGARPFRKFDRPADRR